MARTDRSEAAKKAAETRRQHKLEQEYREHNVRRPDPETGMMEVVSTAGHPEIARHPPDPLPEPVTFAVKREGNSGFADGQGQVVLRFAGPGGVRHAQLQVTVTDSETFEALTSVYAPWYEVTLSPRHAQP